MTEQILVTILHMLYVPSFKLNWMMLESEFNPLSTIGLLTPFLIGSYLVMFTCVANYDKALKMLHAQTCT